LLNAPERHARTLFKNRTFRLKNLILVRFRICYLDRVMSCGGVISYFERGERALDRKVNGMQMLLTRIDLMEWDIRHEEHSGTVTFPVMLATRSTN
jgi:hypothetical protein